MSIPPPSSVNPIVGGTPVLSNSQYANFATERESALANFQSTDINPEDDTDTPDFMLEGTYSGTNGNGEGGIYHIQPLPEILSNRVRDTNLLDSFYTKSYFNPLKTEVYTPYKGIPAPPSTDYIYYKTVVTPDDKVSFVYKHKKTGKLKTYSFAEPEACNRKCPDWFSPVCGTDGITYRNQCKLDEMNCKTFGHVDFEHPGYCYNGFNARQYVDYLGKDYNVTDSNYTAENGAHYIYVTDGNLNTVVKKVKF